MTSCAGHPANQHSCSGRWCTGQQMQQRHNILHFPGHASMNIDCFIFLKQWNLSRLACLTPLPNTFVLLIGPRYIHSASTCSWKDGCREWSYHWGCWGGGWGTTVSGAAPHLRPQPCCSSFAMGAAVADRPADCRCALRGCLTLADQNLGCPVKDALTGISFGKSPWRAVPGGLQSSLLAAACGGLPPDPACFTHVCQSH